MTKSYDWVCEKCSKTFDSKEECVKHEKTCKKTSKLFNSKTQIQEYKRKCKECGKVWHSLIEREKQIEGDKKVAALNQFSNACACNSGSALQAQRNAGASQDTLDKLRRCPNCGSQNYKEEIITYEKKE